MPFKLNQHTNQRDYYQNEMYTLYVGNVFLKSADGTGFEISIENDGAMTTEIVSWTGFIPTYVLKYPHCLKYLLGMDNDGVPTKTAVGNYAISRIIVESPGGTQYLLGVDNDGAISFSVV